MFSDYLAPANNTYSTQSPPTARQTLLKDLSYKKRRKITPKKKSTLLTRLHNHVLCMH